MLVCRPSPAKKKSVSPEVPPMGMSVEAGVVSEIKGGKSPMGDVNVAGSFASLVHPHLEVGL